MGFKIRKSLKIAPGLRINLSKSGVSASAGKPGATVNVGKKGVKSTVGIPGTGISHTTNHSTARTPNQEKPSGSSKVIYIFILAFAAWILWAMLA